LGTNTDNYSALLTTTLQNFQPSLVDNFSDATPFLWWMTQNERKRHIAGGTNLEMPLMYAGANVQAFSGFDKLDTEPTEGIAPATFLWKKYQVPVVISRDHETDNMGESQIISLIEAKVKQAEISMKETLNYDLLNNGKTGHTSGDQTNVPDSLRVVGLNDICQVAAQGRVYGGIAGASHSWWANKVATGTGFASGNTLAKMRTTYLNASRGNDTPDLVLTSQEGYENYDASLVDQKRFVNTMAADIGFESLMFRGSTILYDRDIPAEFMYMLNSNYLQLNVHPEVDMQPTEFRHAENQWARFSRILWKGCLTCTNRARQGLILDVDTA
jgi:hypothetical protein